MEQPTATVSVSLEEPQAPPPVETPPPQEPAQNQPPAQVQTPPNAEDADPEGVIAAPTGEKYVPLSALQAERGKRKDAERNLTAKDGEVGQLKQKAELYDQSATYLQQAKPYIEALRANPALVQQIQNPGAPKQQPAGPLTDQQAEAYARRFDLFTADGKPDVGRAQEIAKDHQDQMRAIAQQTMAPLVQSEAQRQAATLYQQILQQPDVNGVKLDPRALAEVWSAIPPEMIAANPAVAEIARMVAIGRQVTSGQKPIQAPPPALVTEPAGGGTPTEQTLNATSQRFLSASGMKEKDFRETRSKFDPARSNSLE